MGQQARRYAGLTAGPVPWDVARYDEAFSFVPALGADLLPLLAARPGETVLDLGCGSGELTARIVETGASVLAIDGDPAMVAATRRRLPGVDVALADGHSFILAAPVDAVFSNAALHWMTRPAEVVAAVRRALAPGGRFVAEMGAHRNVETILGALRRALEENGYGTGIRHPWYFPRAGEYADLLEQHGFRVARLEHFPRQTPLTACPDGVADWVRMFGSSMTAGVPPARLRSVLDRVNELAAPDLLHDGVWIADYWRLRFVAVLDA